VSRASAGEPRAAPVRSCEAILVIAYSSVTDVPHLRRSEGSAVLDPGLTAGPTHYRLFEAGLEMVVCLVLWLAEHANQARSAGSA